MRTGLWVTWTRMVGRGGIVSSKIVRLQKDLSLLTTKRSCSKSGFVNDRKVRGGVEGVDQIQVLSMEFKIDLLLHEEDGTFTVLETIILSGADILVLGSQQTQRISANACQFSIK